MRSEKISAGIMSGKERVKAIVGGRPVDRCAYWTGCPHGDSWPALFKYFDCNTPEEIYRFLGDDVRWIPVGSQPRLPKNYLVDCDSVAMVEDFPWPNPEDLDLSLTANANSLDANRYYSSRLTEEVTCEDP